MGDPVTMAVVGGSVGAMMNKKDPLKGAMLGAIGGYGGATLLPTLGAGTAATGGMTGANVAGTAAGNLTAVPSFGASTFQVGANAVPTAGIFSSGGTAALGGASPMTAAGPSTGMIPSALNQPTFMESVSGGLKDIGQYAQQNPALTQMAMQTGQSLLSNPQQQPAPAGIMRGSPSQVQMPQYQVGVPKVSLI